MFRMCEFVYDFFGQKLSTKTINEIIDNIKCPWFNGRAGDFILKVKSSYFDEKVIKGVATVNLKHYDY